MPYKEKSQYDEFQRIKAMSNVAGIPKIMIDDALRYHKKISEMKTFRGCNRDGVIAASIYIASRINNFPRTAREIATIFHLDNTAATKGCKNAVHLLNKMEKDLVNSDKTHFHHTKPINFIERYCSRLNINKELTKVCEFVALRIQQMSLMPEDEGGERNPKAPGSSSPNNATPISTRCACRCVLCRMACRSLLRRRGCGLNTAIGLF